LKSKPWLVVLAVLIPALAGAQETRLVNCRTLEAAGNFIASDEVLVNDMVCQKVKAGAPELAKPQPPKPLPGATISGSESTSATVSRKPRQKAGISDAKPDTEIPVKNGETTLPATPVTAVDPAPTSAAPLLTGAKTELVVPPKTAAPEYVAAPEPARGLTPSAPPASTQPVDLQRGTISEPAPVAPSLAVPSVGETPNPAPAEAAPAATPAAALSKPADVVQPSAPAELAPTTPPVPAEISKVPAPPPTISPVDAPASTAAPAAMPDKGNGFYDANAGNTVMTVAPSAENAKTDVTSAEPAKAPAEATPPTRPDGPAATQAALPPPYDPNEERERVVRLGEFERPREEASDPRAQPQAHSVPALREDGFQDGQRPDCTKNITLGSLQGEKLVLGTPAWAAKWIEKNQKRMPRVCFSDMPMQDARNYLIVFYTSPAASTGPELANTSFTTLHGTPASGVGTFTTSYGSTWHYFYDRTVGVTVNTRDDADEPHNQAGQVLYATAYSEEGMPVAQQWPEKLKKQVKTDSTNPKKAREARSALEQVSNDLLSQLAESIAKL
jgi:hypothetical protein